MPTVSRYIPKDVLQEVRSFLRSQSVQFRIEYTEDNEPVLVMDRADYNKKASRAPTFGRMPVASVCSGLNHITGNDFAAYPVLVR